jgi:hypothetical protein
LGNGNRLDAPLFARALIHSAFRVDTRHHHPSRHSQGPALPLSPLLPKVSPWPRMMTPLAPIKPTPKLARARLLPWHARTAAARHGCRRREVPLSRTRSSFCSPVQSKPWPPSPSAATTARRHRPDFNHVHKPSLGMPLDLPKHFPDLELRRGRRNSTGSAAPSPRDHIA